MDTRRFPAYHLAMSSRKPAPVHVLSEPQRSGFVEKIRQALAYEPAVRTAFLYGSFARGEPFRDVDIGLEMAEPFGLLDVAAVSDRLWEATGRPTFDLDVVPLNDAPPAFRVEVEAKGILLVEAESDAALEFAVRARAEWLDLQESRRIAALDTGD